MIIRPVEPQEYGELGALTLDAYTTLDGHVDEPEYEVELADVRSRAEAPDTLVLVAVDDDGRLLGGVTYVLDRTSPFAEKRTGGRGLDPHAGGGAERHKAGAWARRSSSPASPGPNEDGKAALVLHTTPWMTTAHRLYEGLGFAPGLPSATGARAPTCCCSATGSNWRPERAVEPAVLRSPAWHSRIPLQTEPR